MPVGSPGLGVANRLVSHSVEASLRPSGEMAWSRITGSKGGVGPPEMSRALRSATPRRLRKWTSRLPRTAVMTPAFDADGERYGLAGVPLVVIARWPVPFALAAQTSPFLMKTMLLAPAVAAVARVAAAASRRTAMWDLRAMPRGTIWSFRELCGLAGLPEQRGAGEGSRTPV